MNISRRKLLYQSLSSIFLLNIPMVFKEKQITPESFVKGSSNVLRTTLICNQEIDFQESPLINHLKCCQLEEIFLAENRMISQSFEYSIGRLYTKRVFVNPQARSNWIVTFVRSNIFHKDLIKSNLKIVTPEGTINYRDLETYVHNVI